MIGEHIPNEIGSFCPVQPDPLLMLTIGFIIGFWLCIVVHVITSKYIADKAVVDDDTEQ